MLENVLTVLELIDDKLNKTKKSNVLYDKLMSLRKDIVDLIDQISAMTPSLEHAITTEQKLEARQAFDRKRINDTLAGLDAIVNKINNDEHLQSVIIDKANKLTLANILANLRATISSLLYVFGSYDANDEVYLAARMFATDFTPFSQSQDPFVGANFQGYCWGHTHHWARTIEQNKGVPDFRMVSTKDALDAFKVNWTVKDVLLNRIGFYFPKTTNYAKEVLWEVLEKLKPNDIFNFNFYVNGLGFHSTGIRMLGEGIEYIDSNKAIFHFKSRHDFICFMQLHLSKQALYSNLHDAQAVFITVYRLPYRNVQPDNIPVSRINVADRKQAIAYYERFKLDSQKGDKRYIQSVLYYKKQELEMEAPGTKLLDELKSKIEAEIKRLREISETTSNPIRKKTSSKKAENLQAELDSHYKHVKSKSNESDHDKTCLLFALMTSSLSTKRSFNTPMSYQNIASWADEKILDQGLIKRYLKSAEVKATQRANPASVSSLSILSEPDSPRPRVSREKDEVEAKKTEDEDAHYNKFEFLKKTHQ